MCLCVCVCVCECEWINHKQLFPISSVTLFQQEQLTFNQIQCSQQNEKLNHQSGNDFVWLGPAKEREANHFPVDQSPMHNASYRAQWHNRFESMQSIRMPISCFLIFCASLLILSAAKIRCNVAKNKIITILIRHGLVAMNKKAKHQLKY